MSETVAERTPASAERADAPAEGAPAAGPGRDGTAPWWPGVPSPDGSAESARPARSPTPAFAAGLAVWVIGLALWTLRCVAGG